MLTNARTLAGLAFLFASSSLAARNPCEAEVSGFCVSDSCPEYCAASAATPQAVAECRTHCTAADFCKLKPAPPDANALQKRTWAQLMGCVRERKPAAAVEPPARKPLPSDEPPFKLKRVAPTAPPPASPKDPAAQAAAKVAAKAARDAARARPAPEPEVSWRQRSTPSWSKLKAQAPAATPPPAANQPPADTQPPGATPPPAPRPPRKKGR